MNQEGPSADWLSLQHLPGILPARQRRSRETTVSLLEAGADLLRTCAFDDLSIDDLCAKVGVTIGAFYGRFESKDAFYNALLSLISRRCLALVEASLAADDIKETALKALCWRVVEVVAECVRQNEGVMRAAHQYKSTDPSRWGLVSEVGNAVVSASMPLLLARMGRGRPAAKTRTIGFSFQMLFGTLMNAVLNKPRLVTLDDPEMVDRLALAMFLQLEHEARTPAKTRARRIGGRG